MEKTKVKNQSQKNEIPTKGNKSIINSNLTVMKNLFKSVMALFIGAAMFSCQQAEEPTMDQGQAPETRAFGDTPVVAIYVETNDTNPLNAGDYTMSNGKPFAGIVELFASNVRKRTVNGVVEPTLYLNDKMTNLLENNGYLTYVKPLQDKGIKVLLTVLGDHQGIGVASMNSTQTTQFAQILAHAVAKYGLDGIGFDDEYADDWGSTNSTSYSEIITKLHALMPADKLITVFDWGYTGSIMPRQKPASTTPIMAISVQDSMVLVFWRKPVGRLYRPISVRLPIRLPSIRLQHVRRVRATVRLCSSTCAAVLRSIR